MYHVASSPINGKGCFASKFIPAGTVWWSNTLSDMIMITKNQFNDLVRTNSVFVDEILKFTYFLARRDALLYICDNGRFMNHSFTPNSELLPDGLTSIASRDIQAGEEICEDYRTFDHCPWVNLYGDFGKTLGIHNG